MGGVGEIEERGGSGVKRERGGPGDFETFADIAVGAVNFRGIEADAPGWPTEEKFAGIVARFVVDIHVAGVIWRFLFFEPRVSEPGPVFGDEDEIAAPFVINSPGDLGWAIEDFGDAGEVF